MLSHIVKGLCLLAICPWAATLPAEEPPTDARSIFQKFFQPSEPSLADPDRGLELLQQWFDANRGSVAYLDNLDYVGQCIQGAYRADRPRGDPARAVAFLERELSLTKDPKAVYILNESLALTAAGRKEWAKALAFWEAARQSMLGNDHPYFTTRQSLALLEIGKVYHEAGDDLKAIQYLEACYETPYAKENMGGELCRSLGGLYEAHGQWKKAKELYEHFLVFSYYAKEAWMRELLPLAQQEDRDEATRIARTLADSSFAGRRQAFHALRKLFDERGKPKDWVGWIDVRLKDEANPQARTLLSTLRQHMAPADTLGSDPEDRLPREMDREDPTRDVFKAIIEKVVQEDRIQGILLGGDGPDEHGQLRALGVICEDQAHHRIVQERYAQVRAGLLANDKECPLRLKPGTPAWEAAQRLIGDCPDWRSFLRRNVASHGLNAGLAALFLYSLGNLEDIPFLIDQLPDSAEYRSMTFWSLATLLYREGTVDVPEAMGLGDFPYQDWWHARVKGDVLRAHLSQWWEREKATFRYTQNGRKGMVPVALGGPTDGISVVAEAPELDGLFGVTAGGFRDYDATLWFVDFATGRKTLLIRCCGGRKPSYETAGGLPPWKLEDAGGIIRGICWNPTANRLEFRIGEENTYAVHYKDGKPVEVTYVNSNGPFATKLSLPRIVTRGTFTYEVRAGNLYRVDEAKGVETCLIRFGYVLGLTVSRDGRRAMILDRDALGPSVWLAVFE